MKNRLLAIVNPAAGGGRCARRAGPALAALRDAGLDITVRETVRAGNAPGGAIDLARHAVPEGWGTIIAVGGDGTLNEILNGVLSTTDGDPGPPAGSRPTFGLVPLGTGNSFLRDFGAGDIAHALDALIAGRRQPCDVLRLDHGANDETAAAIARRYFINVLGFGFPADVGALVERRLKPFGAAGYTLGVLTLLARLRYLELPHRLDDQDAWHRTPMTFLSVCNSRYTGGTMEMAPTARTDDGELDLIRVDRAGRGTLLRTFPKIFKGRHVDHPAVEQLRAKRIDFDSDVPVDVNLDGEVMRLVPRAIEVLPGAVDIAV